MFVEELEMTLECALNIRKHLVRILENRTDSSLESQLRYVDGLISQATSLQGEVLAA